MKFAHKVSNVNGGNRVVSVTVVNGKALTKVTDIPAGFSKRTRIPMKDLEQYIKQNHEVALREQADHQ